MNVLHISRVEMGLVIESILSYQLTAKKNEHTKVSMKITIDSTEMKKVQDKAFIGDKIVVWGQYDSDGKEELLFQGMITNFINYEDRLAQYIDLECVSNSYQKDRKKISRSFQNTNKTVKDIIKESIHRSENVIFTANDKKLTFPMIQYFETDWEASIRVASYCSTSIFPSYYSDKPQLYFGLPEGIEKESIEILSYSWELSTNWMKSEEKLKHNFLILKIDTYELLNWGDHVNYGFFDGNVIGIHCRLDKGVLVFRYAIGKDKSILTYNNGNWRIQGAVIKGIVLDTEKERVKLHLDIDKYQNIEEAFWYPWTPESGNILYCMPEKGTTAALYVASPDEIDAYCIHSVRTNGESHPEMKDTNVNYLTSQHGKRLKTATNQIQFDNQKSWNGLCVGLYDDDKMVVNSFKNIGIFAEGQITMKAKNIFMQAPSEVSIIKKDIAAPTVINMCNSFDVLGDYGEVTMAGKNIDVFPVKKENTSSIQPLSNQLQNKVFASTPVVTGENKMENCLSGIKISRLSIDA